MSSIGGRGRICVPIGGQSKVRGAMDGCFTVAPSFGCPVRKFHFLCLGSACFGETGGNPCLEILDTLRCSSIAAHPRWFSICEGLWAIWWRTVPPQECWKNGGLTVLARIFPLQWQLWVAILHNQGRWSTTVFRKRCFRTSDFST